VKDKPPTTSSLAIAVVPVAPEVVAVPIAPVEAYTSSGAVVSIPENSWATKDELRVIASL
jgi:hypothetical protein